MVNGASPGPAPARYASAIDTLRLMLPRRRPQGHIEFYLRHHHRLVFAGPQRQGLCLRFGHGEVPPVLNLRPVRGVLTPRIVTFETSIGMT